MAEVVDPPQEQYRAKTPEQAAAALHADPEIQHALATGTLMSPDRFEELKAKHGVDKTEEVYKGANKAERFGAPKQKTETVDAEIPRPDLPVGRSIGAEELERIPTEWHEGMPAEERGGKLPEVPKETNEPKRVVVDVKVEDGKQEAQPAKGLKPAKIFDDDGGIRGRPDTEAPDRSEAPTEVLDPTDTSEAPTEVLNTEHRPPDPATRVENPDRQPDEGDPNRPRGEGNRPDPEAALDMHFGNNDRQARERAIDTAEAKLRKEIEQGEGGRIKRFARRVWKGTLAHEYYRQKYTLEAQNEIRNDYRRNPAAHEAASEALIDRVIAYDQMGMTGENGESVELMGDSEGERWLKDQMRDLVGRYARDELSVENLREERVRVLDELRDRYPDVFESAHIVADNMVRVAEQAKALVVDHEANLDQLLQNMNFYTDKVRGSLRTEVQKTSADRIIERIRGSKAGKWVNEATMVGAVSTAVSISQMLSKRGISRAAAIALPGVGGIAAGAFAGMRENMRMKQERATHGRERASGQEFADEGRRGEMEQARYETKLAGDLTEELKVDGELDADKAKGLLDALGEARARLRISDMENIDLVAFSGMDKVDQERLQLTLAMAEAQAKLRAWHDNNPDQRGELGQAESFDQLLEQKQVVSAAVLEREISEKDATFKKMKRRAVAKAVAKGVLTGVGVGLVAQEAMAAVASNTQGEFESIFHHDKGADHQSLLRGLLHPKGDHAAKAESATHLVHVGRYNEVRLPKGFSMHHHEKTLQLVRDKDHKVLVDKLLTKHGAGVRHGEGFTQGSLDKLHAAGITNEPMKHLTIAHKEHVIGNTRAEDYLAQHKAGTVHVERQLWYDNDTQAPVFDKNELKLWWGGNGNNGLDHEGNYTFNVSQMSPDGSYHTQFSTNAQELIREGKMRVLLSASENTQHRPFSFRVDSEGNAHIPKDSVAGRSLFTQQDGHAVYDGRYAEAAQVVGREHGRMQVKLLATYEGKGVENIRHPEIKIVQEHKGLTALRMPAEHGPDVVGPPVIPIVWRREMEEPVNPPEQLIRMYYDYGRPISEAEMRRLRERMSPRLENPDAQLDPYEEAERYLGERSEEDREYTDELVAQIPDIESGCRMSVAIPVAGHQEGKNIYRTLESYTNQTADPESFEVVLFVNRPEKTPDGEPVEPDDTRKEIDRFVKDHPEMRVRVMEGVLPGSEPSMGRIRKLLTDAIIARQYQRGKDYPELIIASNDADAVGVAPEYVATMIEQFESHPEADAFLGQVDWDPETYLRYPLLHASTRFFQYTEALDRRLRGIVASSGANFAFRSSIYAGVGGYVDVGGPGEDVVFGRAIKAARDGAKAKMPIGFAGTSKARVYVSARRSIDAMKRGSSPYEMWNHGFSAHDELRTMDTQSIEDPVDFESEEDLERFRGELERVINRSIERMVAGTSNEYGGPGGLRRTAIERSLGFLGIQYEWNADRTAITITNIDTLVEGLRNYGSEGYEVFKRRTATT